jgi:hypothetical protein
VIAIIFRPLAGGVVVVRRGVASQFECAVPHPIGRSGDVRGHAGEGGVIEVGQGIRAARDVSCFAG